jgi:hypothetical protein
MPAGVAQKVKNNAVRFRWFNAVGVFAAWLICLE